MNFIGPALLISCGFLAVCDVARSAEPPVPEAPVPEPFQGFDDTSGLTINYDELTSFLNAVVVDVGRSDRVFAEPPPDITGTRLKPKITRTANEGNRFFYEAFKDNPAARQYLRDMQHSLQNLPIQTPLDELSRDEQLAYWLNLYNVTVLNQVIAVYPKRSLKRIVKGEKSIFKKKLLVVSGVPLSLDDIEFTILKQNYDSDPLILYGLYQGIIGGPNIRTSAYYGDDVYRALEENAYEFINSNRGTYGNQQDTYRVSSFYARNRAFFPNFDRDLSKHLLQYLEGGQRDKLQAAYRLKPNIDDWTVNDLGGTRHKVGGSLAHNQAALLDSFRSGYRSVYGGYLTATLVVKQPEEEDDPQEDAARLKALEAAPVEGAQTEGIADSETATTE